MTEEAYLELHPNSFINLQSYYIVYMHTYVHTHQGKQFPIYASAHTRTHTADLFKVVLINTTQR